jgi:class 3 adenylate cyclase
VVLPGGGQNVPDTAVRTVMFTDLVGSTELTQRLGDNGAFAVLRMHDEIVRDALVASKGREIKHTGDGIMACFMTAGLAARCASDIQRSFAAWKANEHNVKVRIGAAAGEPVEHNQDLFGTTVQLAARLCGHAAPEQILVTSEVCDMCSGDSLVFNPLGAVTLKGFQAPVMVHALGW